MTTTTENPTTGMIHGSQRLTSTDTPWWRVRHSLAAALYASVMAAAALYYFGGIAPGAWTVNFRLLAPTMNLISATPTLATICLVACMLMVHRNQRRSLKLLCGFLAVTALMGAGLNVARQTYGPRMIERLIEQTVPVPDVLP
jgi:ABC-type nitrate/sulfonate/bicarbonate transport system permease component